MYDMGVDPNTPNNSFNPSSNMADIFSSFSNMADIFSSFFHRNANSGVNVGFGGVDVEVSINISLKDAVCGCQKNIDTPGIKIVCHECSGSRCKPGTSKMACVACAGRGKVLNEFPHRGPRVINCTNCNGHGDKPMSPCPSCNGTGEETQKKSFTVNIPPGVDNGSILRLAQMGAPGINMPPGDLFVRIQVLKDPKFDRNGINLHCQHHISLCKALKGGDEQIELLDGSTRSFAVPQPIKPGASVVLIKNAGIRFGGRTGDLYIVLQVKLPERVTARSVKLIEELENEGSFNN
jgi:molecular chaperone DnaJ